MAVVDIVNAALDLRMSLCRISSIYVEFTIIFKISISVHADERMVIYEWAHAIVSPEVVGRSWETCNTTCGLHGHDAAISW